MKRVFAILSAITLIFIMGGTASAAYLHEYSNTVIDHDYIGTTGGYPRSDHWYKIGNPFPSWYNSNEVDMFKITLKGYDERGDAPINVWIDFDRYHYNGNSKKLTYYNVDPDIPSDYFYLTFDLMLDKVFLDGSEDGSLIYFGDTSVGDDLDLASFNGETDLWIGYACHFKHKESKIEIGQNPTVIPEPATLFLFGSGLIGLAGFSRRRFFIKS